MGRFSVLIKPSAAKEIERIPHKKDRQRIVQRILQLAKNPRPPGSLKLSGHDRFRIRQGNYRIIYSIESDKLVVFIVKVAHRKDVYKGLP